MIDHLHILPIYRGQKSKNQKTKSIIFIGENLTMKLMNLLNLFKNKLQVNIFLAEKPINQIKNCRQLI